MYSRVAFSRWHARAPFRTRTRRRRDVSSTYIAAGPGPAYVTHKAGHESRDMKPGIAHQGASRNLPIPIPRPEMIYGGERARLWRFSCGGERRGGGEMEMGLARIYLPSAWPHSRGY